VGGPGSARRRRKAKFAVTTQEGYLQRSPHPSSLYDVLDLILDKGLVIDLYVRVSLVGIELLTIDARIVVASVDTYLRFAEAVNRLDLSETGGKDLPEFIEDLGEGGGRGKTKGALEGAKESVKDVFSGGDSDDDKEEAKPRRRSRSADGERQSRGKDEE
jgi:gas vesicle structural protein